MFKQRPNSMPVTYDAKQHFLRRQLAGPTLKLWCLEWTRRVASCALFLELMALAVSMPCAVSGASEALNVPFLNSADGRRQYDECSLVIETYSDYGCDAKVSVEDSPPSSSISLAFPCADFSVSLPLFAFDSAECYFDFWEVKILPVRLQSEPDRLINRDNSWISRDNPWIFTVNGLGNTHIVAHFNYYPLAVMTQPQGAAIYEGMSHRLSVEATGGVGIPHYDWKKDGASLHADDRPLLEIAEATVMDAGEYWCTVNSWVFTGLPIMTADSDHVTLEVYPRAASGHHAMDMDRDWQISLLELLRVIQFYNMGALHCQDGSEDGYAPGAGDTSCAAHHADYLSQDWQISLPELLRVVQFFNAPGGAYHAEPGAEDGFAPQAG